jgi:4-hydroxy-4-methyl-2-oxoglutarate aldolase
MSVGFRMATHIERPEVGLVDQFVGLHSCDISDVANRAGTMVGIRPVYVPIPAAVGVAVTVSIPAGGVNLVKLAMEQTLPGDVLVVSARGDTTCAVWGGNLTRGLRSRGVRGLIIDGAVRDVTEIRADGFPVFARGVATAIGPVDASAGEINVPIACGGVVVNPGDIIVADEDGIAVVSPASSVEVLDGVRRLMAQHDSVQQILLRGEVTHIAEITAGFMSAGLELFEPRHQASPDAP